MDAKYAWLDLTEMKTRFDPAMDEQERLMARYRELRAERLRAGEVREWLTIRREPQGRHILFYGKCHAHLCDEPFNDVANISNARHIRLTQPKPYQRATYDQPLPPSY